MERHELMAASVASAARGTGLATEEVERIAEAHALAMEPRVAAIEDDHDPAFLHPGRTALVLLQDVGDVPVDVLCAAAIHETERADLRVEIDDVRAALGDAVADIVSELPLPGDERLLERLVTLDEAPVLAALAERLDQLRHAHLWEDHGRWRAIYDEAVAVWVPVAERTHRRLADRYRHWGRTFAKRLKETGE